MIGLAEANKTCRQIATFWTFAYLDSLQPLGSNSPVTNLEYLVQREITVPDDNGVTWYSYTAELTAIWFAGTDTGYS